MILTDIKVIPMVDKICHNSGFAMWYITWPYRYDVYVYTGSMNGAVCAADQLSAGPMKGTGMEPTIRGGMNNRRLTKEEIKNCRKESTIVEAAKIEWIIESAEPGSDTWIEIYFKKIIDMCAFSDDCYCGNHMWPGHWKQEKEVLSYIGY